MYWPGVTELNNISRKPYDKAVYTAQYQGDEVIVKGTMYVPSKPAFFQTVATFLNFVSSTVSVAKYIDPNVVTTQGVQHKKTVTMTTFAKGESPQEFGENEWSWITNKDIVYTMGAYWRNFRYASINFARQNPDAYANDYTDWKN